MKALHIVTFILLIIGGLNWGSVGIGMDDLVTRFLGAGVAQIVFVIVGLAAVVEIVTHKSLCKACGTSASSASPTSSI